MSDLAARIRAEFPLLARTLAGVPITYLDHASTAPRSRAVLAAITHYQHHATANVHRGVHPLAAEASSAFEAVRHAVANHLGGQAAEVVFTHGTTDAINLVARALELAPDDEVVVTGAEHHANLLPWRARARVVVLPSHADGTPRFDALASVVGPRTRVVAVHHASNVLGTLAPIADLAAVAHAHGAALLVDGAQAAGHVAVDVDQLGCDFYAFSGHKLGGPAGVGALWARTPWLSRLAPDRWGGGMVAAVGPDAVELRDPPHCFEAGTPNVEGVLGLGAALALLRDVGMAAIEAHGKVLAAALVDAVRTLPGVRIVGDPTAPRIPLVALALPDDGLDAATVARTIADTAGVLVSAGAHCAHPLHAAVGASATLRASAWITNDVADVERFVDALRPLVG